MKWGLAAPIHVFWKGRKKETLQGYLHTHGIHFKCSCTVAKFSAKWLMMYGNQPDLHPSPSSPCLPSAEESTKTGERSCLLEYVSSKRSFEPSRPMRGPQLGRAAAASGWRICLTTAQWTRLLYPIPYIHMFYSKVIGSTVFVLAQESFSRADRDG